MNNKNNTCRNGNSNRNNKNYNKDRDSRTYKNGSKAQDPMWYAMSEADIKSMASFPQNSVVGAEITDGSTDFVPGFLTIPINHICGSSNAKGAAKTLDLAADTYFQYVTQGFTGGVDFEAPDLFMTAICAASLAAFMAEGPRALAYLGETSDLNNYYPEAIIKGLGFDYDSLVSMIDEDGEHYSKADFMADFNIRAASFNKVVALPKDFFIHNRWKFLAENVFSDNDQVVYNTPFAYVMNNILMYDGTTSTTGTCVRSEKIRDFSVLNTNLKLLTVEEYFHIIDTCLAALTNDDCRAMFGAIRRVYSGDWFVTIPNIDKSDWVSPIVRNDIVSAMLHNADFFGDMIFNNNDEDAGTSIYDSLAMTQNADGTLRAEVFCSAKGTDVDVPVVFETTDQEKLIDSWGTELTPGNILDITSNMVVRAKKGMIQVRNIETSSTTYVQMVARSEICLLPILWHRNRADELQSEVIDVNRVGSDEVNAFNLFNKDIMFMHFNSHPFIKCRLASSEVGDYAYEGTIAYHVGEIDKYFTISSNELNRMHARSYFTLFALPKNSKSVTK